MGRALPLSAIGNSLVSGKIHGCDGEHFLVVSPQGLIRADRAAGCLLVPQQGDEVLLALLENGAAWILHVLVQKKREGTVQLPDAATIRAESLHMEAPQIALKGESVRIGARLFTLSGTLFLQSFKAVRLLARSFGEKILRRTGTYGTVHEQVSDLLDKKAGRIRIASEGGLRVRAETADVRAQTLLDMDAEHIKLG